MEITSSTEIFYRKKVARRNSRRYDPPSLLPQFCADLNHSTMIDRPAPALSRAPGLCAWLHDDHTHNKEQEGLAKVNRAWLTREAR
jgi:hypothetical protein